MMLLPRRRRQVGAGGVGLLGPLGLHHDDDGVDRAGVLTYLPTAGLAGCLCACKLQLGLVCFDGVAIWISDLGFFGCVVFLVLGFLTS